MLKCLRVNKCSQVLESHIPVEQSSNVMMYKSLHHACLEHSIFGVKQQLALNANINATTWDGQTPLIICCDLGYNDLVSILLSHGADIHIQTPSGLDALYLACFHGYVSIVSKLMQRGADATTQRRFGSSPLEIAAKRGYLDVLRTLGCFGIDLSQCMIPYSKKVQKWLNHVRHYNWCPFDYALDLRQTDHIQWLLHNALAWIRPIHVQTLKRVPYAKDITQRFHQIIQQLRKPWTRTTHRMFISLYGTNMINKLFLILTFLHFKIECSDTIFYLMEFIPMQSIR